MQRPSRRVVRSIWHRLVIAAAVALVLSVVTATAASAASITSPALLYSDALGGTITNTITMSGYPAGSEISLSLNGVYQNSQIGPAETFTVTSNVQQVNVYVATPVDPSGSALGPSTTFTDSWVDPTSYAGIGGVNLTATQASGSVLTEGTPTKLTATYGSGTVPANSQIWIVASSQPYGAVPAAGATVPITSYDIIAECKLSNYTPCSGDYTPPAGQATTFFEAYIVQYSGSVGAFIAGCSAPVVINWNTPSNISLAISPTSSQTVGSTFNLSSTISPPGYSYDVYICDITTGFDVTAVPNPTYVTGSISQSSPQTDTFIAYLTNTNIANACSTGSMTSGNGVAQASNTVTATWTAPTATPTITLTANPTSLTLGSATTLTATPSVAGDNVSICDTPSINGLNAYSCTSGATESVTHYQNAGTYYFQAFMAAPGAAIPYASNVVAVTWGSTPSGGGGACSGSVSTGSTAVPAPIGVNLYSGVNNVHAGTTVTIVATANIGTASGVSNVMSSSDPTNASLSQNSPTSPSTGVFVTTATATGNTRETVTFTATLYGSATASPISSASVTVTFGCAAPTPTGSTSSLCILSNSLLPSQGTPTRCLGWGASGVFSGLAETTGSPASNQPNLNVSYWLNAWSAGSDTAWTSTTSWTATVTVASSTSPVVFPNGQTCTIGMVSYYSTNQCQVVAQSSQPQTVVLQADIFNANGVLEGSTNQVSVTYLSVPPATANISCNGQAPGTDCIVPYGTVVPICTQFSVPGSPLTPSATCAVKQG